MAEKLRGYDFLLVAVLIVIAVLLSGILCSLKSLTCGFGKKGAMFCPIQPASDPHKMYCPVTFPETPAVEAPAEMPAPISGK